jgi:hypothetical protein
VDKKVVEKSGDYNTDFIAGNYYQTLVDARMQANVLLTKLEAERDPQVQEEFKRVLSFLAKEMEAKYQRRENKEKPDPLENMDDYNMTDVCLDDCRDVLEDFRDLQEKLGITSMARREYQTSKKGAEKKDE